MTWSPLAVNVDLVEGQLNRKHALDPALFAVAPMRGVRGFQGETASYAFVEVGDAVGQVAREIVEALLDHVARPVFVLDHLLTSLALGSAKLDAAR